MIKIIKHGETKFRIICPICGCEFEYEHEDLVTQYSISKQIKCPDCGEMINHKEYTTPSYPEPSPINPLSPGVTWTTPNYNYNLDCDKCPNKPDPNKIIVGDTPCSLCPKNKPYCSNNVSTVANNYTGASEYQKENPLIVTVDDKYEIDKDITIRGTSALVRENGVIKVVKRTTTNSKEGNFNRLFITNYERDLFFKSARRSKYYKENKKFAIDQRDEQLYNKWSDFMDKRFINIFNEIKENRIKVCAKL